MSVWVAPVVVRVVGEYSLVSHCARVHETLERHNREGLVPMHNLNPLTDQNLSEEWDGQIQTWCQLRWEFLAPSVGYELLL